MVAGSNLHISQGMEVSGWKDSGKQIRLNLQLPRNVLEIFSCGYHVMQIEIIDSEGNRGMLTGKDQLFEIPVKFDRETQITINY